MVKNQHPDFISDDFYTNPTCFMMRPYVDFPDCDVDDEAVCFTAANVRLVCISNLLAIT